MSDIRPPHRKGRWSQKSSDYDYEYDPNESSWTTCSYDKDGKLVEHTTYYSNDEDYNKRSASLFIRIVRYVFGFGISYKNITYEYSTAGEGEEACLEYLDVPLSEKPSSEEIVQKKKDRIFKRKWWDWALQTFGKNSPIEGDALDYYDIISDGGEIEDDPNTYELVEKILNGESIAEYIEDTDFPEEYFYDSSEYQEEDIYDDY
ncbi:hypothetical protein H6G33_10025 [Calothrix sp. FACHB-1219]|uniref:hypothetical protein n=1 Tax=unclassified Calothrix TaxID=2619626 RepID=UPI001689C201|nr:MULTISPECIES: hypothetical protein [unclassified Calothrix]MBD2201684.1 hypothetical protein [Calothrix sp. FACHB-168]MBD2217370.1 hypothetical protein [Calothrix sp. FACHB-1219]